MAFNRRWSVPCLLLATLALLVSGAAASQEVTGDTVTAAGQQFDSFVFTLSANLPKRRVPVTLSVTQPVITGGGLTLVGWGDNSVKGEYAFSYVVDGAAITDSSLIISKAIPADGTVTVTNTQVQNTLQMPAFDFSSMFLTGNLTVAVRNSFVQYSESGSDSVAVQVGSSQSPALISDHTMLQVIGLRMSGGSCALRMAGAATTQSLLVITEGSLVGLDHVDAAGLSRAALCLDGSLTAMTNSVLRVTDSELTRSDVDGRSRSPKLIMDTTTGTVSVLSGSALVVRNVNIVDGGVIGSTAGSLMDGALGADSVISILDIDALEFCPSCSVEGFPSRQGDNSYVYAQDWTIGGSVVTDYSDRGLGYATGLTNLRDSNNKCRAALCVSANANAIKANAQECMCNCKDNAYAPMCLSKPDTLLSYEACTDSNCVSCPNNAGVCSQCRNAYAPDGSGRCVVTECDVADCQKCNTSDKDECEVCNPGYGMVSGTCSKCDVQYCTECDGNTNVCTLCLNNFALGSGGQTCTSLDNTCQAPNCVQCVVGDITKCAMCALGYGVLSGGQCSKCTDAKCETCDNNLGQCSSCDKGYTLTSYGTCSPGGKCTVANCAYCKTGDTKLCDTCIADYELNTKDSTCVPAGTCLVNNCAKCATGRPNFCQTCNDHYARNSNGVCVAVLDPKCKVADCHYCVSGYPLVCQKCLDNYAVTSTGKCAPQSWCKVAYCTSCLGNNASFCGTCFNGFSVQKNGSCLPTSMGASAQASPRALLVAVAAMVVTAVLGLI